MSNSVLERDWVSLANILEATDITPKQKIGYTLDIGGSTRNIRKWIGELNVLDADEVLAECDRLDQLCRS